MGLDKTINDLLKLFVNKKVTIQIISQYSNSLLFLFVEDVVIEDGAIVFELESGSNVSIDFKTAKIYPTHIVSGDGVVKVCL